MFAKGDILEGKYRLDHPLGSGGFASVWAATNLKIERQIALKILSHDLAHIPEVVERFQREAKLASQAIHPAIVQVEDISELSDGTPFLVMQLLRGHTIDAELNQRGKMTVPQGVGVAQGVLEALAAAHARGIIHRDIKPANIFLVRPGTSSGPPVRILDLGTAKDLFGNDQLTQAGQVMGTTDYLAPEIFLHPKGDIWRPSVDVYAMGMVLFAMITGGLPFQNEAEGLPPHVKLLQRMELFRRIPALHGPADFDRSIPAPVDVVVRRALAIQPADRYRDAGEMADALIRAAQGHSEPLGRPAPRDSGPQLKGAELDSEETNTSEFRPPAPRPSHPRPTAPPPSMPPPSPPQQAAPEPEPEFNDEVATAYFPSSAISVGPSPETSQPVVGDPAANIGIQASPGGSIQMEGSLQESASFQDGDSALGLLEPATTPRASSSNGSVTPSPNGEGSETPLWASADSNRPEFSGLLWLGLVATALLVLVMTGAIAWVLMAPAPVEAPAPSAPAPAPEPTPAPVPTPVPAPVDEPPGPEVTVRLLGLPQGAEASFAGEPIAGNSIAGREGDEGELIVRAEGYQLYRRRLVLRPNQVISVRMLAE